MASSTEPSYTALVYEVLRSAEHPLSFREIFDAVEQRRPITTRNPKATIRNALSQGSQLVRTDDGRYDYLPHRVRGSLLRIPLTEKKPAQHPLIFPDDVRHALWPSFLETQKRRDDRPVRLRLPGGAEVTLPLEFFGQGVWGSRIPETLRRYLVESFAAAGDSLLIRVLDAETGLAEAWHEPRRKQNAAAVAQRNRELADHAVEVLRTSARDDVPIWDLVIRLLARGAYHSDVAPDPLEVVLHADPRFVDAGFEMWILAEKVTPAVALDIRRRHEAEKEIFASPDDASPEVAEVSAGTTRYAMERAMADVAALLAEHPFESIDEANAFLQKILTTGQLPHRPPSTALEQAQDLMYEAWETTRRSERIGLARRALTISPDCADAYVLLAEETARSAAEAAELYAQGVAAGERALGKRAFTEDAGHFWGIIETRPYMRARLGLAQALWALGKEREAIDHAWDLLRLNPGDNQGVRYELIGWLLDAGDSKGVARLLSQYPDDAAAVWQYARALHAFRAQGDTRTSRQILAEAKEGNRFVPDYLLGKKRLPGRLPAVIGFGDEREAVYCAVTLLKAWHATPGAVAWLASQIR